MGSILYLAFFQPIADQLPLSSVTVDLIQPDRRIELKDYSYQLDRYSGRVAAGLKTGEDTSMAVDLFDKGILESYFYDPRREKDLRTVAFRIVDKLYTRIQAAESSSLLLYDFNHLPKGSYQFYSREQFLSYLEERGLGKAEPLPAQDPAPAKPPTKKKLR